MGAKFIKRGSDFYLRLNAGTTDVQFKGALEADTFYTLSVDSTQVLSNTDTIRSLVYTSGFVPATGTEDNSKFSGYNTTYTFTNSSGITELPVTFTSTNGNSYLILGGELITGSIYAYPGSSYLEQLSGLTIKDSSQWKDVDTLYVKDSGIWKTVDEVSIKDGGTWKTTDKILSSSSSSYINITEGDDDDLDFCIYVIAQN